eukprot:767349-Hanusia_phi.AAC.2
MPLGSTSICGWRSARRESKDSFTGAAASSAEAALGSSLQRVGKGSVGGEVALVEHRGGMAEMKAGDIKPCEEGEKLLKPSFPDSTSDVMSSLCVSMFRLLSPSSSTCISCVPTLCELHLVLRRQLEQRHQTSSPETLRDNFDAHHVGRALFGAARPVSGHHVQGAAPEDETLVGRDPEDAACLVCHCAERNERSLLVLREFRRTVRERIFDLLGETRVKNSQCTLEVTQALRWLELAQLMTRFRFTRVLSSHLLRNVHKMVHEVCFRL